jgi:hypothetical protein
VKTIIDSNDNHPTTRRAMPQRRSTRLAASAQSRSSRASRRGRIWSTLAWLSNQRCGASIGPITSRGSGFSTAGLLPGTQSITATYNGDGNVLACRSPGRRSENRDSR